MNRRPSLGKILPIEEGESLRLNLDKVTSPFKIEEPPKTFLRRKSTGNVLGTGASPRTGKKRHGREGRRSFENADQYLFADNDLDAIVGKHTSPKNKADKSSKTPRSKTTTPRSAGSTPRATPRTTPRATGGSDAFDLQRTNSLTRTYSATSNASLKSHRSYKGDLDITGSLDVRVMEGIEVSRHSSELEAELVREAQPIMKRRKGRSIDSIRANPTYGVFKAASKRGVTLVTHNIALGGRDDAKDRNLLKSWGITHVLNVARQMDNFHPNDFVYLKLPLTDTDETPIGHLSDIIIDFISQVEEMNGRVFIHCISGVSRTSAACLMHMMIRHGLYLRQSWEYLYSCRPIIAPNDGFKFYLANLETKLFHGSSVALSSAGPVWDFYLWNNKKASMPLLIESNNSIAADTTESIHNVCLSCVIS